MTGSPPATTLTTSIPAAVPGDGSNSLFVGRTDDLSTKDTFGPGLVHAIAGGLNQNSIIGQVIQNQTINGFPTGITGYGILKQPGNQVVGVFGRADAMVAGGASNEVDVFNFSGQDAPNVFPSQNNFGTTDVFPIALIVAGGGTKKNYAGIYLPANATSQYRAGIYADPASCDIYGLFIDADATHGPVNSAVLENTGTNGNTHLTLKTTGPTVAGNPVLKIVDANGIVRGKITQDGNITLTAPPGASSRLTADSDAGQMQIEAAPVTGGSCGVVRWNGAGVLFIDALSSTGVIQFRTGTAAATALSIGSDQKLQPGAASWENNGTTLVLRNPAGQLRRIATTP